MAKRSVKMCIFFKSLLEILISIFPFCKLCEKCYFTEKNYQVETFVNSQLI